MSGQKSRQGAYLRRIGQESILIMVDAFTGPAIMSKEEALEYLGELQSELDMRKEALTQELAEEKEGGRS